MNASKESNSVDVVKANVVHGLAEYQRIATAISFARPGIKCMLNHTRSQSGAMLISSISGKLS